MDESGLLMAPLLRRSWAPKGQPPASKHKAGHREKVSVAAALWLPPRRDRLHLAYQTLVNGYFNNEAVAGFLHSAVEGLAWPWIVVWDRGNMHRGDPIRDLLAQAQGRLDLEPVPPHSPELIPVEQLWKCLKYGRLCNFTPGDANELHAAVVRELEGIGEDQELLQSFFHLSALPLPRALLS
jgi:DDE superfamily endonuclease